jgi:hypothetical protein
MLILKINFLKIKKYIILIYFFLKKQLFIQSQCKQAT